MGKYIIQLKLYCAALNIVPIRIVMIVLFDILNGARQGDPLYHNLFGLYIDDIPKHFKENGPTLILDNLSINCFLYADDMVLIAEIEEQLKNVIGHDVCVVQ